MKRLAFGFVAVAVLLVAATVFRPRETPRDERLAAQIGRMLMVGFEGRDLGDPGVRRTIEQAKAGRIGGVILLGRNIRDERTTSALSDALHAANPDLIVALDQEGGRVARLRPRHGFPRIPSAASVATMGVKAAETLYGRMARDLKRWGIDLNFGPVVDLAVEPDNPIITRLGRAFGKDAGTVVDYARAFMLAHDAAGVMTAVKHFPGHGSSVRDTHLGAADVSRTWSTEELEPYRALKPSIVMTAHVVNRRIDASGAPMTLSSKALDGWLRARLGFEGVIVSDDLQMDAVEDRYSEEEAAEAAVRAGVDLLLFANDGRVDADLVDRVTDHVLAAAETDGLVRERIERANRRLAALSRPGS